MNTRASATTILAALLAVLTLASSAWAECAWVLWRWDLVGTLHKDEKVTWTASSAIYSEEQCQSRENYENLTWANLPPEQRASHDRSWLCLPAGADPHHLTKTTVHRAKAGCGWVLWQQEVWHPAKPNESVTWLPTGGDDTAIGCQVRAQARNAGEKRYQGLSREHEATIKEEWELKMWRGLHDVDRIWLCAPVGADPRAPKEATR